MLAENAKFAWYCKDLEILLCLVRGNLSASKLSKSYFEKDARSFVNFRQYTEFLEKLNK